MLLRSCYLLPRMTKRKLLFTFLSICMSCFIYYDLNSRITGTYMWKNKNRGCRNDNNEMRRLHDLVKITHGILNELGLEHFLMYGSLWGALRYNNPLPWDYDFDFGILYEDLKNIKEEKLISAFNSRNVSIVHRPYAGSYYLQKGEVHGDLLIFSDWYNNGVMHRIGIESYLFFIHYRKFHIFPSRLVEKPLPKIGFSGLNISSPREGIEMQKYLYPMNWMVEVKPDGCLR